MKKEYEKGIQQVVLEVIKQSRRMGLKYITKKQIIEQVKRVTPELKNTESKVGQALYQLQRTTKYRRPRIKKFYDGEGKKLGWAVIDETGLCDIYHLPK